MLVALVKSLLLKNPSEGQGVLWELSSDEDGFDERGFECGDLLASFRSCSWRCFLGRHPFHYCLVRDYFLNVHESEHHLRFLSYW